MLECFLVVAISINDHVVSRTLSYLKDIRATHIEMTMAIEAGRRSGDTASFVENYEYTTGYGYDCGSGWVNKGVTKADVRSIRRG